ncbi:MAG: penicillin-binding protein [Ruminococcaceae bacterium]|nr:penicillin-binding protein [Oscillospiraceae bacterium]
MRTTGKRSVVLYILLFAFLFGMGFLTYRIYTEGEDYISHSYNGHIYADNAVVDLGVITDRNNILLFESADGKKAYSDNLSVRLSTLHTVGDRQGYIGTSVLFKSFSDITGYNFITGLNELPFDSFGYKNLKLTIDAELSAKAYEVMGGKKGAVLICNYRTGEILCKVSTPTYDPMNIPSDILENEIYGGVFLDNTLSSSYTPGSVFKIVTTLSAIENIPDWANKTYVCEGEMYIGNTKVTCLGNHGELNMNEAMGHSCNIYFAKLALDLGNEKLQATAERLGFNKSFTFGDVNIAESEAELTDASDEELAWAAVGQYTVSANPMHMLILTSAIANGGTCENLHISEKDAGTGEIKLLSKSEAEEISGLLRDNVQNYYGDYLFEGMNVAAKTGTAEVGGDKKPNSWMIGFSQNSETPYAFVIVMEDAGSGLGNAGNAASILLNYMKDKNL